MDRLIFHNDRVCPLDEARLSPGQTGLLMGWGVFTTLRLYRGLPFAFERHWARLARDAARLGITLSLEAQAVRQAMVGLARANHRPEGMARLSLVKNAGGLWAQAEKLPPTDLLIFTRDLVPWPARHRLKIEPGGIFSGGPYAGAKMLSWAPHTAVLEKVRAQGFDEALLLNERGRMAECTSANIFLVREGKALTPPLSSGCLPGITREILLEIADRSGIEVREQELEPEALASADEVFLTSTTREVAAVESISPGATFTAPGKTTSALARIFQDYVQFYLNRM